MNNQAEQLDQAISLIKQGRSTEQAVLQLSENKEDITPLLSLAKSLSSLPKNVVPTPLMQKKYADMPAKNFWLAWIHISKVAGVSMSIMLVFSAVAVAGYSSYNSAPGQTLFAVKKTAEKLQLAFTYNEGGKANLQVAITQKRLSDAQNIFNDPASNLEQEKAALTELSSQTKDAIAVINNITKNDPKSTDTHPLLASLETITKQQQTLLKDIKPGSQIASEANNALQELSSSNAKISEIKQLVAVASNDQALAKLNSNPNATAVAGEISQINKELITVDKTDFIVTDKTIVKDAEGKIVDFSKLSLKTKVNIVGLKDKTSLIAQEILIVNSSVAQPEVKSASTSTITTSATGTPDGEKSAGKPGQDPSQAQGLFIFEDPNPQFAN